eukprot:s5333_g3.t1
MRLYRRWKEFTETQRTTHETSLSYEREGEATAWADVPDISRRSNDDPNPKGRGKGKGKGKNKGKDEGLLEVKGKSTDQLAKSACAFGQPELVRNQELPVEACKGRGEPRQHLSRDQMASGTEGTGLEEYVFNLTESNSNFKSGSRHVRMHINKKEPKAKTAKGNAMAKAKAAASA